MKYEKLIHEFVNIFIGLSKAFVTIIIWTISLNVSNKMFRYTVSVLDFSMQWMTWNVVTLTVSNWHSDHRLLLPSKSANNVQAVYDLCCSIIRKIQIQTNIARKWLNKNKQNKVTHYIWSLYQIIKSKTKYCNTNIARSKV